MSNISSKGALLDGFYFKFVFCIFEAFCNDPEVLGEDVTLRYRKINVVKNTSLLSKETKSTCLYLLIFIFIVKRKETTISYLLLWVLSNWILPISAIFICFLLLGACCQTWTLFIRGTLSWFSIHDSPISWRWIFICDKKEKKSWRSFFSLFSC